MSYIRLLVDLEKGTFISSVSPYPEEEYYLGKSSWSTTAADWDQRFEVGDVVADPSGSWTPSTAEAYIDSQIATVTENLTQETIGRQTGDRNLQTQLNSEMATRADQDANLNALINAGIREGGGVQFDIVPTQNSANGITSGGMYSTLKDSNIGFVDDEPRNDSKNLVKSDGIFKNQVGTKWTNNAEANHVLKEFYVTGNFADYSYYYIWFKYQPSTNMITILIGGSNNNDGTNITFLVDYGSVFGNIFTKDFKGENFGVADFYFRLVLNTGFLSSVVPTSDGFYYTDWALVDRNVCQDIKQSPTIADVFNSKGIMWTDRKLINDFIKEIYVTGNLSQYSYYYIWFAYDTSTNILMTILGGSNSVYENITNIAQVNQNVFTNSLLTKGIGNSDVEAKMVVDTSELLKYTSGTIYLNWALLNLNVCKDIRLSSTIYSLYEIEPKIPKFYKGVVPVKELNVAYDTVSASTGYPSNYGKYWETDHFENNNDFISLVYAVTPGQKIHLQGWNVSGNLFTVYFSDADCVNHIANGSMRGTANYQYYDYEEQVPAGANYVLIQQAVFNDKAAYLPTPRLRIVEPSNNPVKTKRVFLLGDSLTQMGGHAVSLMNIIRQEHPDFELYNYAIGGEKITEICARWGSFQMLFNPDNSVVQTDSYGRKYVALPADTTEVSFPSSPFGNSWNDLMLALRLQDTPMGETTFVRAYISGILCRINKGSGNTYTIRREAAASAASKLFVGDPVIPNNLPSLTEDDIIYINIGANGGYDSNEDIVNIHKALVRQLGTKKYIISGIQYVENIENLYKGKASVIEKEAMMKKEFGDKYFSLYEYFLKEGVDDALNSGLWNSGNYPTDVEGEVHPNQTDINCITNGLWPIMFRTNPNWNGDVIHFSQRTYNIVFSKLYERMKRLGYF